MHRSGVHVRHAVSLPCGVALGLVVAAGVGCGGDEPEVTLNVQAVTLDVPLSTTGVPPLPGTYWVMLGVQLVNETDDDLPLGAPMFRLVGTVGVAHLASQITETVAHGCAVGTYVVAGADVVCNVVFAIDDDDLPTSLIYEAPESERRVVGDVRICPDAAPHLCGHACVDLETDEANCGACGNVVATCVGGAPSCGELDVCDGRCADTRTDPNNCGACGRVVSLAAICVDGEEVCADGFTECDGACVDLTSEPDDCGA